LRGEAPETRFTPSRRDVVVTWGLTPVGRSITIWTGFYAVLEASIQMPPRLLGGARRRELAHLGVPASPEFLLERDLADPLRKAG
jgi:hypothetical protein